MKASVRETLQRVKQIMAGRQRSRAKAATIGQRITPGQWQAILARYAYRCAYCHKNKPLTKDHVIPLSRGGSDHASNIIPACQSCNSRKGARPANQYHPLTFPRV